MVVGWRKVGVAEVLREHGVILLHDMALVNYSAVTQLLSSACICSRPSVVMYVCIAVLASEKVVNGAKPPRGQSANDLETSIFIRIRIYPETTATACLPSYNDQNCSTYCDMQWV